MKAFFVRFDPRRSLAAAIGWVFVALSVIGASIAAIGIGALARDRLEAQTGSLFQQYALQVSNELDIALFIRLRWLRALGIALASQHQSDGTDRLRTVLEDLQAALPEFEWIGLTDTIGNVLVGAGGLLEGERADQEPWFLEGRKRAWIGDVRDGHRPGKGDGASDGVKRYIELAAPIARLNESESMGVIAAQLSWAWMERLERILTERLKAGKPIETMIVSRDNVALSGPKTISGMKIAFPGERTPGEAGQRVLLWPDGVEYLSGYAVSDGAGTFPGLGWTVWVREPVTSAFADVRRLELQIFAALLALGLVSAGLAILATNRMTRNLTAIAQSADDIRRGDATEVAVPSGRDEAARIGHSLRTLVDGLQHERAQLKALNAELDARVAARTREVERLSEESRHAAVIRERLRMARDLHDTLAHSMMALLTEIRVLRRLADKNPSALKDELANAEEAAHVGLNEARAAIAQLRHDAVRDIGFGAALALLLKRFEDRHGLAVSMTHDEAIDALADARTEALYRIAEESLHNIERHAQAAHVEIRAHVAATDADKSVRQLTLEIVDDGAGFDVTRPRPGHFGIRGMREQAELVGASLDIRSSPGHGTHVSVTLIL
ncbi:MAG: histidine kinase [Burkholderiales bacterium]